MTPEEYSEFMTQAIVHLAEQLNAIRQALENPMTAGEAAMRVGDPLSEELGRLAGEAMRLLGRQE
jgi:hypothetical protein